MSIAYEIPSDQIHAAMEQLFVDLETVRVRPALQDCATLIRKDIGGNFTRGGSDAGQWPPRKDPRDGGRSGWPGHPLLIDLGNLFEGAAEKGTGHIEQVGEQELTIGIDGTAIPYALAHQYGVPERNLPERPYMVLNDDTMLACEGLIENAVYNEIYQ